MTAKKRKPDIRIFIACEGSSTELLYFEKLKKVMENKEDYPYTITIYPDKHANKNPKTDAIGLVNVAIEKKNDFDELWVVFDRNGYTKHTEAFELAKENNINIAFSSISFEVWILLHFERHAVPYTKSEDIINEKFHKNIAYLTDYAKSDTDTMYINI